MFQSDKYLVILEEKKDFVSKCEIRWEEIKYDNF